MKYLNLGCGSNYSSKSEWTNLDFSTKEKDVIGYNLLQGIPFDSSSFDLIYHSHVLEHFSKESGKSMLEECFRVLKKGGVLRIAIPDLEVIITNYLKFLKEGCESPENKLVYANYNWTLIELFDQMVRSESGGQMAEWFRSTEIINDEFVNARIGIEATKIRAQIASEKKSETPTLIESKLSFKEKLKRNILCRFFSEYEIKTPESKRFEEIGKFRLGGEIHQWMYDRYSLNKLLGELDFSEFTIRTASESFIENWSEYELDSLGGQVKKPDSLFVEVKK